MTIHSYSSEDYDQLISLYKQPELYGGIFDEARDVKEKLQKRIENDPEAILVAEKAGKIVGSISL